MRACNLDRVARCAERGMGGDTLWTWHNKFAGTGTSQTCKGKEEFEVTLLTERLDETTLNTLRWTLTAHSLKWVTLQTVWFTETWIPASNYMFKVNNRNTRARCEICSKLTIKIPERRQASFWYLYC